MFADGFDLAAVVEICGDGHEEYALLDLLDSLVRKSLITVDHGGSHVRYGMLETIRQYAEEQLGLWADPSELRDHHATYYAGRAVAQWELWDGPRQRLAVDWVETEFANLRAAFRWAAPRDLTTAAAIAAHTTFLAYTVQRFEPIDWAEEILAAPGAAELALLPRVYTAASVCQYTGRVDAALDYASAAIALEGDAQYDAFQPEWTRIWQANAHRIAGHDDEFNAALSSLLPRAGLGRVWALTMSLYTSPIPPADRATEPTATAEETMIAVRAHGNPYYIALAGVGFSRALSTTDADRAREAGHEALTLAQVNRIAVMEPVIIREIAALDVVHGRLDRALESFDRAIDTLHRAGNIASLAPALVHLVALFDRLGDPDVAATIYGHVGGQRRKGTDVDLPAVVDHVRAALGETRFQQRVAAGTAMDAAAATRYVRAEIARARAELAPHP